MKSKSGTNLAVPEKRMILVRGSATAPGIAIGPAYVFKPYSINLQEFNPAKIDSKSEKTLFAAALKKVLEQLEYANGISEKSYGVEFSGIFESQKAFLSDQTLIDEIHDEIDKKNISAAHAVNAVLSAKSEHFINLENKFFRDRAFDIIDLKQKLVLALLGREINYQLNYPGVVVAEDLSPTDTVNFNRNLILGLLTDHGGATSHTAILARGLNIPAIVNGNNLSTVIKNRDMVIVDGFSGDIVINPDKVTLQHYRELKKRREHRDRMLLAGVGKDCVSADGVEIRVMANVEFAHEVEDVERFQADGIGLYRTEALFLERRALPDENEQYLIYKQLYKALDSKPLILRTIDLGGDKLLDGYKAEWEPNPFLGWRAIRFCLDNPLVFRAQLRAAMRAAGGKELDLLLPMISSVSELESARKIIENVFDELQREGVETACSVRVGVMIETPAAAVMADVLATKADFLSIGSNDLTQYVLAVDRTNNKVAKTYNAFDPAVIRLMAQTVAAAEKASIPVSLCGEMASVPSAVPLLLGMGLRVLSVTPQFVPLIKNIVRHLNCKDCGQLYQRVVKLSYADQVEQQCQIFFNDNMEQLNLSLEEKS